jgi:hypothetical protein
MKKLIFILLVIAGLSVAVYGSIRGSAAFKPPASGKMPTQTHTPQPPEVNRPISTPTPQQIADAASVPVQPSQPIKLPEITVTDEQGAIIVEITPINSNTARNSLNFNVRLTTHSIDLSMDLAALAVLSTEDGRSVQAITWDAPRGGHHVDGTLTFPSLLSEKPLLDGAKELTLTIKNLDAPERVFRWDLQK